MVADFTLPSEVDWTVDELAILPDECRYGLIDGRLDLWDRAPLLELAGLALMAALKVSCPPEFRVRPRVPLWPDNDRLPAPDVVVLGPGGDGDIRLVVDVVRPGWLFADMLARTKRYSALSVPIYWVFEPAEWVGVTMTVFRPSAEGGFEVERSASDLFTVDSPYPVTVDLPALSDRWPQTFEYAGTRESPFDSQ